MTTLMTKRRYRSTEAKYKGGAQEMYVTYDLHQKTRGAQSALYHKVRRVYIAGDVTNWRTGQVRKRTGREVHGLRIESSRTAGATVGGVTRPSGARPNTWWSQGPSLRPLSGSPRWLRFRPTPKTHTFILATRNCHRNTERHCSKSGNDGRSDCGRSAR